jgi:hypothetical protein
LLHKSSERVRRTPLEAFNTAMDRVRLDFGFPRPRYESQPNIEKALRLAPFKNRVPLQRLQTPSYIYGILIGCEDSGGRLVRAGTPYSDATS